MSAVAIEGPANVLLEALLDHVRERAKADPWTPHLVVVPDQRAADVLTMRVAEGGGAFGLEILTLRNLAGRLAGPGLAEPLATSTRLALMHAAARASLGPIASPPLAEALIALYDSLLASQVPPPLRRACLPGPVGAALDGFANASACRLAPVDVLLAAGSAAQGAGGGAVPRHLDLWAFLGAGPAEARLLGALARRSDLSAYLALAPAACPEGRARRRLRAVLDAVAHERPAAVATPTTEPTLVRVAQANPAAEADAAARIVASWACAAAAPHRIAVIGPADGLDRVAMRLGSLGLAVRHAPVRLEDTVVGQATLKFLRLWADDDPDALVTLLALPLDPAEADAAARLGARLAQAAGGLSARTRLRAMADDADEGASELAILVRQHLDALDRVTSWRHLTEALSAALADLLGEASCVTADGEATFLALTRLAALDGLAEGAAPERALAVALARAELGASAPPALLRSAPVELLAFEQAAGAAADAVVLLGLAAEDLGALREEARPLGEEGRAALARAGHALDGPEEALESRLLGAGVAIAGTWRVAAVYVAQGATGPRPPHPLVATAPAAQAPALPLDVLDSRRALLAGRRLTANAAKDLAAGDSHLAAPARWLEAARSSARTAYDGQIELPAPPPTAGFTPSVLEAYGRCPYVDFLSRLLGLEDRAEAEVLDDAEPGLDVLGRIAHSALEHLRRRARSEEREPLRSEDLGWVRAVIAEGLGLAFAGEAQSLLAPVHRIALEIELGHAVALEIGLGDLVTLDSEWRFGPEGAAPLEIVLPDGARAPIRGRIDRIARTPAGLGRDRLWVIDYKTGRSPHARIDDASLQLPLYMLAVAEAFHRDLEDVSGRYASVTSRGGFALAVLHGRALAAQRAVVAESVARIVGGMAAGDFAPRPGPCPTCRFRPVCPADIVERGRRKGQGGDAMAEGADERGEAAQS